MIVQWCIKGLALEGDVEAERLLDSEQGLLCNWWRDVERITPSQCRRQLSAANLDRHVNHFSEVDPRNGRRYGELSPFISLTAGVVERDAAMRTNYVRSARQTALWFGTDFGRNDSAYLFICWLVVAPRQAVEIEGMAEEVRDLNSYRRYSEYQTEGEITAKVSVPDNQILGWERWDRQGVAKMYGLGRSVRNSRFTPPEMLINIRDEL